MPSASREQPKLGQRTECRICRSRRPLEIRVSKRDEKTCRGSVLFVRFVMLAVGCEEQSGKERRRIKPQDVGRIWLAEHEVCGSWHFVRVVPCVVAYVAVPQFPSGAVLNCNQWLHHPFTKHTKKSQSSSTASKPIFHPVMFYKHASENGLK
jgi:hypothetical protein